MIICRSSATVRTHNLHCSNRSLGTSGRTRMATRTAVTSAVASPTDGRWLIVIDRRSDISAAGAALTEEAAAAGGDWAARVAAADISSRVCFPAREKDTEVR